MKNILSRANQNVLMGFARSNVLLAFDYDGTLAPIVSRPEHAAMRQATRRLMARLAKLYPCIVISGRARTDVLYRLRGMGICEVIGNHGVEPWQAPARFKNEVRCWLRILEQRLSSLEGLEIEDKTFSISVHYRHARKKNARAAILKAVAVLGQVRTIHGKQVVNLIPIGARHKGVALQRACKRLRCTAAIYVGDDETDEDVFGFDLRKPLLTIRVGAKRTSLADYFVPNQSSVDRLLRALAHLRQES